MDIRFEKYQGAGNDFIILDDFNNEYSKLSIQQLSKMCDRKTGIGADGVIILVASQSSDFEMKYYNCDGKLSTIFGNAAR